MDNQSTHGTVLERYARWLGLVVASVDAVVAPTARVSHLFTDVVLSALAWVSAGVLAILFLRILFDRECHRAVNAANAELNGNNPFAWRWISLRDPTWGLFGSRAGGGYLAKLRVVLIVEFVLLVIAEGWGRPQPLLIASAAFGIVTLLTIAQLKDHYPATPIAGTR
jgi:hypothetical protein